MISIIKRIQLVYNSQLMSALQYKDAAVPLIGAAYVFTASKAATAAIASFKLAGACSTIPVIGWWVGAGLCAVAAGILIGVAIRQYRESKQRQKYNTLGRVPQQARNEEISSNHQNSSYNLQVNHQHLSPNFLPLEKPTKTRQQYQDVQRLNWLRKIIEEQLEKNTKTIEWMLTIAEMQSRILHNFFKKLLSALKEKSTQIIEQKFQAIFKGFTQRGNLQKQQSKQLTPEQVQTLLEKVKEYYQAPVRDPQIEKMLIHLFAKIDIKLQQNRLKKVQNPAIKDALAFIDLVTKKVMMEDEDLQKIKAFLKQNKRADKRPIYNVQSFQHLRKQLNISKHSIHHVIPYKQIKQMIAGVVSNLSTDDCLQALNDILNTPQNQEFLKYVRLKIEEMAALKKAEEQKKKVQQLAQLSLKASQVTKEQQNTINKQSQKRRQQTIAEVVVSFIFWNPQNVVLGAQNDLRLNDPKDGDKIDKEILEIQSEAYKQAIKIIQSCMKEARKAKDKQASAKAYKKGLNELFNLPTPNNGHWCSNQNGKYELQSAHNTPNCNISGIRYQHTTIQNVLALIQTDKATLEKQNEGKNQIIQRDKQENKSNDKNVNSLQTQENTNSSNNRTKNQKNRKYQKVRKE